MTSKLFLVVEDDDGVGNLLVTLLKGAGHDAVLTMDGLAAMERLRRQCWDGLILDLMTPRANGFEVLQFLRGERPHMLSRTIVVTAASDATLQHFDGRGVRGLIRKPFDINEVLDAVNQIASSADGDVGMPPSTARDVLH